MAKAGRKRKAGPRTKAGRIITPFDHGTERTQAMQALYGADGCDAIGRAYRAGLLGEGSEAKALLDMGRAISNAYWACYEQGPYRCALSDGAQGSVTPIDAARVRKREEWLSASLRIVSGMGRDVRRAFDQLCIDAHPDSGPKWLDAAIWNKKRGIPQPLVVASQLRRALDALEILAA